MHRDLDRPRRQQVNRRRTCRPTFHLCSTLVLCLRTRAIDQIGSRLRVTSSQQHQGQTPEQAAFSLDVAQLIHDRGSCVTTPIRFDSIRFDSIALIDHWNGMELRSSGFEWRPSSHRLIAHRYHALTRNMVELMMIRGMSDASPTTPWLPNELMFEIFRALFDAYRSSSTR